jgi:hypothetical protein
VSDFQRTAFQDTHDFLKLASAEQLSASRKVDSRTALGKICVIGNCFTEPFLKHTFKYLNSYKKIKTIGSLTERTDLILQAKN